MILYFSGTGNTKYCAEELAKLLGDECTQFSVASLRKPKYSRIKTEDKRIILMFPVYSWGIPPVIVEVLRKGRIDCPDDTQVWMVATCGDDIGTTTQQFRKLIYGIGLHPAAAFSITMPNVYVCMKGFDVDSPEVEKAKLTAALPRIREIADRIKKGMPCEDSVVPGKHPWLKSHIIRPWFHAFCMSSKPFHTNDACNMCGLCIRSCPMENIVPGNGKRPAWGNHCTMCLRCYHICPSHAIEYGDKTAGKGQYRHFLAKK